MKINAQNVNILSSCAHPNSWLSRHVVCRRTFILWWWKWCSNESQSEVKWRRLWHIQQHFSVNIQMALGYFDSGDGLFSARSLACCYINFPFNLLLMLVFFGTMYIHFQSLATSTRTTNSTLRVEVQGRKKMLWESEIESFRLHQTSTELNSQHERETRILMKVLCRAEKSVNRNLRPNLCVGEANWVWEHSLNEIEIKVDCN